MTQAIVLCGNQEDREFFSFLLRQTGLAVVSTLDGGQVIETILERPIDFILLAPNERTSLPRLVERVRSGTQAPLLVLIEQPGEAAHCALLDAGADLVLEWPVSPRILSRYVRLLLQRAAAFPSSLAPLDAAGLRLDPTARAVTIGERPSQPLTQLEFRLLHVLMTNVGQVIPTEIIVERVWGYSGDGNRELVRGLVRRLRRKIEPDPEQPTYIHNLPGVGYRLSTDQATRQI